MSEARIGRLVSAALHQALADQLPDRLEFYEDYLPPRRLRAGTIGLASFSAALSFLRRERGCYEPVMRRAGEYAARWIWDDTSRLRQAWWRRLPLAWRMRIALRLAGRLVGSTVRGSRASASVKKGHGRLEIRGSAFCDVRDRAPSPLCDFYGAAVATFCEQLQIDARVALGACHAMGDPRCRVEVGPLPIGADAGGDEHAGSGFSK